MRKLIKLLLGAVLFLIVAYATLWGTLALWFKLPGPDIVVGFLVICFGLLGLGTLIAIFRPVRWRWLAIFAVALIAINGWWNTLVPPTDANWSPEVARQATGTIDGNILTLTNVRAFDWRTADDFDEKWETRSYDISQIETIDMFMSYWGGPSMAHFMLSFGFANGDYLTFSNEVRRQIGGSFSPIGDFFKANPIVIIAAEEQDVVGLRTNIRQERVQMFRLRARPEKHRELIEAYVAAANIIAQEPLWFNSVFTNCSRSAILLARYVGINLPLDYRIIVNGYFPDLLYEQGSLNTEVSLKDHYTLGAIDDRAIATGLNEGYSKAIREGVPVP